jgi:hypothetical protein
MCLFLMACGGKDGDSSSWSEAASLDPYMNILSPTPGEYIDEGASVTLEAEGRLGDGAPAEVSEVSWVSDDGLYAVTGNPTVVDDLHPGVYALVATGTVAGRVVSQTVDVVVYAAR